MKKNYQRIFLLVSLLILLISYLCNSTLILESILDYTDLFLTKLFPVSFLFFILSSLFIDYGLIELISNTFRLNGSIFYVTMMSLVSGFPSGAKYTKELLEKKLISSKTANYLITFTHFPNPLFILGSVNLILKNNRLTLYILIALILSNLIIALFLKPKEKEQLSSTLPTYQSFPTTLSKAINNSIKVLLNVYGTSLFFYLIVVMINHYLPLHPYPYILLNGLFDLTKGVFSTPLIKEPLLQSIMIISFIAFGGISIHMQVKSLITDTTIQYKNFFFGRMIQLILANALFLLILYLF